MTGFLTQIGKNLADRWLSLLVLPGLLWIAAGIAAYHLGQAHPLDPGPLRSWLDRLSTAPTAHSNAAIVLAATAILAGSASAGLLAGGLGTLLQYLWGASGEQPPLSWIVHARRCRWSRIRETARRKIGRAEDPTLSGQALARATASARRAQRRHLARTPEQPQRPTRMAERLHATAERARTLYGLDLSLAWPRLWTVLSPDLRADITAARDAYSTAARLGAWATLCTALTVFWWPAAFFGSLIMLVASMKARAGVNLLADLIDTAVDLHLTDLADKLHAPHTTPANSDTGLAIGRRLTVAQPPTPPALHPHPAPAPGNTSIE